MNIKTWFHQHFRAIQSQLRLCIMNNKKSLKYLTFFSLYSLLFFIIYFFLQDSLSFILLATASLTAFISNILGMAVSVDGVVILTGNMDLEIIHECTGIFAMLITTSSILSYPTKIKYKLKGILFVIPFIFLLNLVRLLILIYVGKNYSNIFELVHSYLWQGTFIIFIILAWFLWIELVVNNER